MDAIGVGSGYQAAWNLETGAVIRKMEYGSGVRALTVHDGRVVTASEDTTLLVWNALR